jgi:hypothetical protein
MNAGKSKSTKTARVGRQFRSVPVMPTSEASKSREDLNVSKMRVGLRGKRVVEIVSLSRPQTQTLGRLTGKPS